MASAGIEMNQPPSATRPQPFIPLPREKGAYGQLLFPVVSGLLAGHGHPGSWLFALVALGGFALHEPLLVLSGGRGDAARTRAGSSAWRWVLGLSGATISVAIAGMGVSPHALTGVIIATALGAVTLAVMVIGRERTTWGETLAAAAISSWAVPIAQAGGSSTSAAMGVWMTYAAAFAMATISVRVVVLSLRSPAARTRIHWSSLIATSVLLATVASISMSFSLSWAYLLAVTPMALVSAMVSVTAISGKALTKVGYALITASALACLILVSV